MPPTGIADVQQPDAWAGYLIERTSENFEFITSGAIGVDPRIIGEITTGNNTISLPSWGNLAAFRSQILGDSTPLTVNALTSKKIIAPTFERGDAFGANTLAQWRSGDDPFMAILGQLEDYWNRNLTTDITSIFQGLFNATNGGLLATHVVGDGTAPFTSTLFLDAKYKLSDQAQELSLVVCPPSVMKKMEADDEITFILPSQGAKQIPFYKGFQVLVSRQLQVGPVAYTVLMGPAAMTYNEQQATRESMEQDRDILAADDLVTTRRRYVQGVQGVSYTGAIAGDSISDAELILGDNWSLVWEAENVRIACVLTNDAL